MLEHGCGGGDVDDVVHDQLAVAGQEVTALVQLLDLNVLIHLVCNTAGRNIGNNHQNGKLVG